MQHLSIMITVEQYQPEQQPADAFARPNHNYWFDGRLGFYSEEDII